MSVVSKSFPYGPHTVTIETGEMARQADGAVRVSMGDTVVLVTAVRQDRQPTPGRDFFPLTVNYVEKTYAAGRIPGGFFKREGRPTEKETLTSRLIDRPIRPLFPDGFYNEVQVVATGAVAGSGDRRRHSRAARRLRGAGALRHAVQRPDRRRARRLQGRQVPAESDRQGARRVAAAPGRRRHRARRADGRVRGQGPVRRGDARRGGVRPRADAGRHPRHQASSPPKPASRAGTGSRRRTNAELDSAVALHAQAALAQAYSHHREAAAPRAHHGDQGADARDARRAARRRSGPPSRSRTRCSSSKATSCASASSTASRASTAATPTTVRPITVKVGVLPRTHGSALFTRGETQALVVTTLGTDARRADHRRARGRAPRAVHAPLQLPAVLGRRDRHDGLAEAPRDRPRQPGAPRRAGRDAGHGRHSRTSSAWSRKSSSRTARARWRASAAPRWR